MVHHYKFIFNRVNKGAINYDKNETSNKNKSYIRDAAGSRRNYDFFHTDLSVFFYLFG